MNTAAATAQLDTAEAPVRLAEPAPQTAARVAGLLYVVTMATSVYPFFLGPTFVVSGDAARTASNILEHAQAFRVQIVVSDLLTCAGAVVLNAALYSLLAPVHRNLARVAAMFRLVEVSVYVAITVNSLVALAVLSGAEYRAAFEPAQLNALARLFISAKGSGFTIAMLFLAIGSVIYMYLLVRSRFVPKALGLLGIALYALGILYFSARILFPAWINATTANIQTLPPVALGLLGLVLLPLLAFEVILGLWLLIKGVRLPLR